MTSTKSSPVMDTFSLPSGHLAPLQTLREHFLRWMFIEERPHTVLQKASQGLRDLLRGAPRLILPFPSPPSTTLFSLLSYSSRQKTGRLCHILMCTIADRRHVAPGSRWHFHWRQESCDWKVAGVFVSVFVPLLLPWTGKIEMVSLFSSFYVVIVAWCYWHLQWGCFVCCKMFGRSGGVSQWDAATFGMKMLLKLTASL